MEDKKKKTIGQIAELTSLIKNKELSEEQLAHIRSSIGRLKEYVETDPILYPIREKVGMILGIAFLSAIVIVSFASKYLENYYGVNATAVFVVAIVLSFAAFIKIPNIKQIADKISKSKNRILLRIFISKQH